MFGGALNIHGGAYFRNFTGYLKVKNTQNVQ